MKTNPLSPSSAPVQGQSARPASKTIFLAVSQEKVVTELECGNAISAIRKSDPIEVFSAVYAIRYPIALNQLKRNQHLIQLHYEDFFADPVRNFSNPYARVGLGFSNAIKERIIHNSTSYDSSYFFETSRISKLQLTAWHDKTDSDSERKIRKILEAFKFPFYSDAREW